MSVGIAAICKVGDERRIILCFDWKTSTDTVSSETEWKIDALPRGFVAIFAGTIADARELISMYQSHLCTVASFPDSDPVEQLRVPLRNKKRRMVESYVQAKLALTYTEFLDRQEQIDPSIRTQIFTRIHDMNVNVELLIAGYSSTGRPLIFKLAWDEIEEHHNGDSGLT